MLVKRVFEANRCRFAAQLFNIATIIAVIVPFPLLLIWIGASMFVYAANAHHPDERVAHYTRRAGYRFYGVVGAMVIVGQPLFSWFGGVKGVLVIWGVIAAALIPFALRDIWRARRETWTDKVVEVAV